MTTVAVAAAQLGPASATREETIHRIVRLVAAARRAGVQVMNFPELALSPYFAAEVREDAASFAEDLFPSPRTLPIVEELRAAGITAVLPFAELTDGVLYNAAVVISAAGEVIGRYRKVHIPGTVEPRQGDPISILEKRYFAPGDLGFPTYSTPFGAIGAAICYDRRFPETYRCYALGGAALLAIGFNTPYVPGWSTSLAATREAQELAVRGGAVSNGIPILAAGKAGVENGWQFSGASCVVDHLGQIVARAVTEDDELVVAELDFEAAAAARERLNLAENRRPEIYERYLEAAGVLV